MKKKIADVAFICIFMAMISVPALLLNVRPHVESAQENRMLTEWPGLGFDSRINEWYGHYLEDRVGFRRQAITAYTKLMYGAFGAFAEDLHMSGKDGYVFPADEGYIGAYQHLRTDEDLIGDFAHYLKNTSMYLEQKGIPFVFMAGLDKKTVYPEYMPDSIHVDAGQKSIIESLTQHLKEAGVPYVIPVEEYMQAKQNDQIYNRKYDCAHWNDLGKMIAIRLADEELKRQGLDMPAIREEDYALSYELRPQLEFVEVRIDEEVPVYHLKQQPTLWDDPDLTENMWLVDGTSVQYYSNSNALKKKRILIFHDSFLQDAKEFYCARYSQVFFVSRQNYECVQYYVNLIRPDAVVFENAERAFVDDLYAYTNLAAIRYEPPYESFGKLQKGEDKPFGLRLTGAENASYGAESLSKEGGIPVRLDTAGSYFTFRGEVRLPEDMESDELYLYGVYKKKKYEISYPALQKGQPGVIGRKGAVLPFYMSLRKEKKPEGKIRIILVDGREGKQYTVGELNLYTD
ncbi:MAG: hypothetical protein J6P60_04050 [Lachnospiraceae bacterium]|nr:hypothetical protein [Lachnospiraceae bacterium]